MRHCPSVKEIVLDAGLATLSKPFQYFVEQQANTKTHLLQPLRYWLSRAYNHQSLIIDLIILSYHRSCSWMAAMWRPWSPSPSRWAWRTSTRWTRPGWRCLTPRCWTTRTAPTSSLAAWRSSGWGHRVLNTRENVDNNYFQSSKPGTAANLEVMGRKDIFYSGSLLNLPEYR